MGVNTLVDCSRRAGIVPAFFFNLSGGRSPMLGVTGKDADAPRSELYEGNYKYCLSR